MNTVEQREAGHWRVSGADWWGLSRKGKTWRGLFPDLLSFIAPFHVKYVLILVVYYSEIYLLLCPFKDLHHNSFKASKFHGKGAAALPCLVNEDNSERASLQTLSRRRGIAIRDYMVHTIADQFSISYSIITFINLKWFPKQKQRMSSAC